MLKKFITFYLTLEQANEVEHFQSYFSEIMTLMRLGASAGKSMDGKVGWRTYNAVPEEELA